jgi:thiosulfate reductase/polysulfide reductase chain A
MAKEIGMRLGLEDYFKYNDFTEVLDWQLKQLGTSLDEMKKIGVKKFPRKSGPLYTPEGENLYLATESGKIELYSNELKDAGFDPMPTYTAHEQPEKGYYRLNYGRAPMHTFSRTSNNPNLADLMPENNCWINPKVAKIWGIENGQYIWLKNQDGVVSEFPIQVRVTERIRWDSVYMVHGFGHHKKQLTRTFGKGASDTQLITHSKVDPLMGGTGMRGNFVTFLKEEPKTVAS